MTKKAFFLLLLTLYCSMSFGQSAQKSQFVSGVPLDLIIKVGAMKQESYDRNLNSIREEAKYLRRLAKKFLTDEEDKEDFNEMLEPLLDYAYKCDLSLNSNYIFVMDHLDKIEDLFFD